MHGDEANKIKFLNKIKYLCMGYHDHDIDPDTTYFSSRDRSSQLYDFLWNICDRKYALI